jgi:hypothetical protein
VHSKSGSTEVQGIAKERVQEMDRANENSGWKILLQDAPKFGDTILVVLSVFQMGVPDGQCSLPADD